MDKAIIFSVYDFVSFHMACTLLNKGIEVTGIHIDEEGKAPFLEEKRLEVGRNANYREISLSELDQYSEDGPTNTTLILSLYDFYMAKTENILQEQTVTRLSQFIESKHAPTDMLFILPIQLLRPEVPQTLRAVINQTNGWEKNNRFFYLPAIYGPWQPAAFTFQQALSAKMNDLEIKASNREWTGDILYVEDAVETILSSYERTDADDGDNSFLIESGIKNYWVQCAEQMQLDKFIMNEIHNEQLEIDKTVSRVTVNRVTPFRESIEKQLEMMKRLI
ncbi:hypothetical protein V7128_08340 [Neobacillus vireti]|uniref:hypothetical protein n=1 Tax=Neobacillus vireti TaxID=220686 RepID=UPI002FFF452F